MPMYVPEAHVDERHIPLYHFASSYNLDTQEHH